MKPVLAPQSTLDSLAYYVQAFTKSHHKSKNRQLKRGISDKKLRLQKQSLALKTQARPRRDWMFFWGFILTITVIMIWHIFEVSLSSCSNFPI
jgi:hypothetical protein